MIAAAETDLPPLDSGHVSYQKLSCAPTKIHWLKAAANLARLVLGTVVLTYFLWYSTESGIHCLRCRAPASMGIKHSLTVTFTSGTAHLTQLWG